MVENYNQTSQEREQFIISEIRRIDQLSTLAREKYRLAEKSDDVNQQKIIKQEINSLKAETARLLVELRQFDQNKISDKSSDPPTAQKMTRESVTNSTNNVTVITIVDDNGDRINQTDRYQKINDEIIPSAPSNDSTQPSETTIVEGQTIEATQQPGEEGEPDSRCWKYTKIALYIVVGIAILVPLVIILGGGGGGDCGNCGGGNCNCDGCCNCCDDKKKKPQEQEDQIAVATAEMNVI